MMKKLILLGLVILSGQAMAVTVTLPLTNEIDSSDGKMPFPATQFIRSLIKLAVIVDSCK